MYTVPHDERRQVLSVGGQDIYFAVASISETDCSHHTTTYVDRISELCRSTLARLLSQST